MLKCPNHKLPNDIIVNNFYARLSRYDKDMLDASSLALSKCHTALYQNIED